MDKVQTEHEMLAESLGAIRARLVACREEAAAKGNDADALASAMASHLVQMKAAELPLAAQVIWIDRVVRPLKADAAKPLPARAFAAIRSWPAMRVARLVTVLAEIEGIVIDAENDALHEVIYAEISRTYS
jgi:hypothetical protein